MLKSGVQSLPLSQRMYLRSRPHPPAVHCQCHWSKRRRSSINRQCHVSGSGTIDPATPTPAESCSPLDWDPSCSVANAVDWWSRVSVYSMQRSRGKVGWNAVLLKCEEAAGQMMISMKPCPNSGYRKLIFVKTICNKKLNWCWQTRATPSEVSQGHWKWYH